MIQAKHLLLPNLSWFVCPTHLGELLALVSPQGLVAIEPMFKVILPTFAEKDLQAANSFDAASNSCTEAKEALFQQLEEANIPPLDAIEVEAWQPKLAATVKDTLLAEQLPLDLRGTPLQQQAWLSLAAIPLGNCLTYKEFASVNNRPKAIRALASACATNPLPFLLPCHRVVGSNGGLGGFYYGLEMKQDLLEYERLAAKNNLL